MIERKGLLKRKLMTHQCLTAVNVKLAACWFLLCVQLEIMKQPKETKKVVMKTLHHHQEKDVSACFISHADQVQVNPQGWFIISD